MPLLKQENLMFNMKHIKSFESINQNIEIGDWVVLKPDAENSFGYEYFLNNACKVIKRHMNSDIYLKIEYNNKSAWWEKEDIEYVSNNKEEAESYLNSKKYNL